MFLNCGQLTAHGNQMLLFFCELVINLGELAGSLQVFRAYFDLHRPTDIFNSMFAFTFTLHGA